MLLAALMLVQSQIAWTPLDLTASTGEKVPSTTAYITVPERRDRSGGGQVRLFIAKLGATTDRPGPPIVYLAGGPGSAGVPTSPNFSPFVLGLRAFGDVVFYDQRGTGRAEPSLVVPGRLDLPSDQPLRSPATEARLTAVLVAALDTLRARGVDPAAYTTAESVEDLEALRMALGAERLVLWGHSYGSHLALAYVKRYPNRVARLLLGGINGPDHRWRPPVDGDVLLARIDSAVKADSKLRERIPDFLGLVRRVMDRLEKAPLLVEQDGKKWLVGRDEVAATIALMSGEVEFIKRLPQLFTWLEAGDGAYFVRTMRNALKERAFGTAMTYPMHLASGVSPARAARIAREAGTAIMGNAINWPWDLPSFASMWKVPDLGEGFRAPVTSSAPAFLYSGTFDGRTSLADAEEVRRGFPNGVHVVVDGSAHAPHLQSVELMRMMLDFAAGRPVRSGHLRVPFGFRSPDEPAQIGELARIAQTEGGEAAAVRLRALAADPKVALTSYVPGTVSFNLLAATPKRAREAVALLEAGIALFPTVAFLHERLGDGYLALGDTAKARTVYGKAAALDPFTLSARIAELKLTPKPQ
ncbi:MAG: alpha/beta fold hydrolase [Gemmatimonadales bacterium]|nr:alpha/beta fold hydrolase [Gemmatimonadales bacterium]